ncbi:MAG: zinc ribbon domain-containing protein [Candidatus Thermoplasmatota archaeon]
MIPVPSSAKRAAARLLPPLLVWMFLGWLAFPYLASRLYGMLGVPIDLVELTYFSYAAAGLSLAVAIALWTYATLHPYKGDDDLIAVEPMIPCMFCGAEIPRESRLCPACGREIPW